MAKGKGKFVIDVSQHQGVIDWSKVKGKIAGAILRCGYGDDLPAQDDTQFARNLAECERLGIPHGVYLYSYAGTEAQAKSELAHILRLIKGHAFELPVFLDVEENGTHTFAPRACRVVCEGLKKEGYEVGVYSSLSWWNSYLTEIKEYNRWVAHWNPTCGYTGEYLIWQYGTVQVDGIEGEVDANIYYGDTDGTASKANTTKTNKITNKAAPDVIYQVYTDKHGWLSTVKNLEDYAGLDGEAIKGIRLFVNGDSIETVTHQMDNGAIDKVTISSLGRRIRYRVRPIGASDYLSWMENKIDMGGSSDTFAGIEGKEIDRIQIVIKK